MATRRGAGARTRKKFGGRKCFGRERGYAWILGLLELRRKRWKPKLWAGGGTRMARSCARSPERAGTNGEAAPGPADLPCGNDSHGWGPAAPALDLAPHSGLCSQPTDSLLILDKYFVRRPFDKALYSDVVYRTRSNEKLPVEFRGNTMSRNLGFSLMDYNLKRKIPK